MRYPERIHIREVAPRDGLQSEPTPVQTVDKVRLVDMLSTSGVRQINVSSFVSPRLVPQMADAAEVFARIARRGGVVYDASVPNVFGAERAIASKVDAVVVFVSASEADNRRSVNRSVDESMEAAATVIATARAAGIGAVGTVATAFGCPYEGVVPDDRVLDLVTRFVTAGATGLSLGDSSGEASPRQVARVVGRILDAFPDVPLALHFHDTRGLAMANVLAAMDAGATCFDAAVGGIGGSPFTKNSAGNLPTEDLVQMCDDMGIETGVDLAVLMDAYRFLEEKVGHPLPGKVGRVGRSKTAAAS